MGDGQGRQGDVEHGAVDVDSAGGLEQFVEEGASLLSSPRIVRLKQGQQVTLGLEGEHFDDVGEVLPLGREADDSAGSGVLQTSNSRRGRGRRRRPDALEGNPIGAVDSRSAREAGELPGK